MSECLKNECSVATRGRTLDYAAGAYDVLSPPMTFYQEQRLGKRAIELLHLKGDEKVIDIGCGTGSLTIEIAKKLTHDGMAVGIDAAAKMIRRARKKAVGLKQVQFDIAAAERLGYADESFDGAVSTFFFHHIDFELKAAAMNEMWRVLKKGGRAVIVDVDIPTTLFGKICAWSGYILFRQDQIKENIKGKFREAMAASKFSGYELISTHMGYVSIFILSKGV
ncbi:MAG: methyltransferase domain-containing protein [Sedimentisphaerales bacterium]|nr:methyltransferase domain-containing protein [Sedimentisphaerales bacterium]